jgi:vancomycin resistance protein YoaR
MKKVVLNHTNQEVKRLKVLLVTALILLGQTIEGPADHLSITMNGKTITVVNRSDYLFPMLFFPFFNYERMEQLADQVEQQIKKEPVNAGLDWEGNIIPERPGIVLNRRKFAEQFLKYFYGTGPAVLEVPVRHIFPRIDSELIADLRTDMIGHYVTYYNPRNRERSHNIALATKAINNYVLFPGEVFSFNRVVGKRTKEKGYMTAPIIVKGELAEGIGGGICQVSSTLYNAVDQTGMDILERYSHSKRVPYVPEGRDATVSWYGPDFSFKNQYNQPILIRAQAVDGKMIVMIFSSDSIRYNPRKVPRMSIELPPEDQASL